MATRKPAATLTITAVATDHLGHTWLQTAKGWWIRIERVTDRYSSANKRESGPNPELCHTVTAREINDSNGIAF